MDNLTKEQERILAEASKEIKKSMEQWKNLTPEHKEEIQKAMEESFRNEIQEKTEEIRRVTESISKVAENYKVGAEELSEMLYGLKETLNTTAQNPIPVNRAQRRANQKKKRGKKCI